MLIESFKKSKKQSIKLITAKWIRDRSIFSSKFPMHNNAMLIHTFCKICEHEIVLQECKSKQKQVQVHNSDKTRE